MSERALAEGFWTEEGTLLIGVAIVIGLAGAMASATWRLVRGTRRSSRHRPLRASPAR